MNASYSPVEDDDQEEEYLRHLLVHVEKKCHLHHGEVTEKTRLMDCEGGSDESVEEEAILPHREESDDNLSVDSTPTVVASQDDIQEGDPPIMHDEATEAVAEQLMDERTASDSTSITSEEVKLGETIEVPCEVAESSSIPDEAPHEIIAETHSQETNTPTEDTKDHPPEKLSASHENTSQALLPPPKPPKPVFNFKRDMVKAKSTNPFETPDDDTSTNPFASQEASVSTNPFDSSENQSEAPVTSSGKSLRSLLAPSPPPATQAADQTIMQSLLFMGFHRDIIISHIQQHTTLDSTLQALTEHLTSLLRTHSAIELPWSMPFQVRVGSWLPYVENGRTLYYSYFITVIPLYSKSYSLEKRYGQIYDFYSKSQKYINRVLSHSLRNEFPDNKLSAWFSSNEEVCNQRRDKMDKWMKEILAEPLIVLHPKIFCMICDFLEIDKYAADFSFDRRKSLSRSLQT